MMNQEETLDREKWQRMLNIVRPHLMLIQPILLLQFKRLYIKRMCAENILLFLLQYIGSSITVRHIDSSLLWLDTGTACAFLFLRGPSVLPGIFLGYFAALFLAKTGFWLAGGGAVVLVLQVLLLRWFCCYYLTPTLIFYRLSVFFKFCVYAAFLTGITSFLLMRLCYPTIELSIVSFQLFFKWWLANFNAILVFSCAIVTWDAYCPSLPSFKQLYRQLFNPWDVLLVLLLMALCISHTQGLTILLALSVLFLTILIGARFGWCRAMTAICLSGVIQNFARFLDAPVFSTHNVSSTILCLQLLLCAGACMSLSFAILRNQY